MNAAQIVIDGRLAWWTSRATGIVALALVMVSLVCGIVLAGKLARRLPPPAWTLDLHRHLGALAVVFTAVHVAAIVADDYVHFGVADVLVPFASSWRPEPVAWGIVAAYLLVAVEATSLLKRHLPRKLWRAVHASSYALYPAAVVHGVRAGADMGNRLLLGAVLLLAVALLVLGSLRVAIPAVRASLPSRVRSAGGPQRTPTAEPRPAQDSAQAALAPAHAQG